MLGLHAISAAAISALPGVFAFGSAGATLDITDSSEGGFAVRASSYPFITRATDEPANTPFKGTLLKPISFSRSIVNSDGFGRLSVGYGSIELINAEADYDSLVQHFGVDGRRIVLKVGAKTGPRTVGAFDDFVTIADLQAEGWEADDEVLRINVRDKSYLLEVPTQPNTYDGSGGLNGYSDLNGLRKPLAIGDGSYGANVSPVLVIPSELVYHLNDGAVQAIGAVYDSGFALTATSDYATLALLRAATMVPGQYATCLAQGCFRLGGAANRQITCDFQGANSGGYVSTLADVIQFLVENAADVDADDFDDATFALLNVLQTASAAYYLDHNSNEMLSETIGNLMGNIGWAGFTRLGLFEVRRFDTAGIAPVEYFKTTQIVRINREKLPSGIDALVQRVRVTYQHNFTVQSNTDLVGVVLEDEPERALYLSQPHRVASTTDEEAAAIVADHPLATDPAPFVLYFTTEAAAQAEADRLFEIYGTERAVYRFTVKGRAFGVDPGDTIHLTYPRFGLSVGRFGVAVSVDESIENNETTIAVLI